MTQFSATEIFRAIKGGGSPTPEQVQVIDYGLEPLLVLAGAGSGKTETLAFRVLSLIVNHQIAPHQVLALTFTRKATAEMANRLGNRLSALRQVKTPQQPTQLETYIASRSDIESSVEVSTYDSFANRMVAQYGALAGMEPVTLMEQSQEYQLMHQVVSEYPGEISDADSPHINTVIAKALALEHQLGAFSVTPQKAQQVFTTYQEHSAQLLQQLEAAVQACNSLDGRATGESALREDLEKMQSGIGQGETLCTPLQNLCMVSAIANHGKLLSPQLFSEVRTKEGTVVKRFGREEERTLMSESESATLTEFMRSVVTEGTASALKTKSYAACGKTGSAQITENGKIKTNAWFVGFAPMENPRIAVAVLVEDGETGGKTAAPLARKIFDSYLKK